MPALSQLAPCDVCQRRPVPSRQVLIEGQWRTVDGCACTWTGSPEAASAAQIRQQELHATMRAVEPHELDEGAA